VITSQQPAKGTRLNPISILEQPWHFALKVDSVHDAKNFVESRGLASDVEIQHGRTGVTYFFLTDPSGILVEVVEDKRGL